MNGIFIFCTYMTFIYMPWDIFVKPVAEDEEVWFGYMFTGWAAKATAPFHWLIYGFGFYGFLKMKSWMHPWAAVYVLQVAIGFPVFGWLYGDASIWFASLFSLPFIALAVALARARHLFSDRETVSSDNNQSENNQENNNG